MLKLKGRAELACLIDFSQLPTDVETLVEDAYRRAAASSGDAEVRFVVEIPAACLDEFFYYMKVQSCEVVSTYLLGGDKRGLAAVMLRHYFQLCRHVKLKAAEQGALAKKAREARDSSQHDIAW